MKTKVSKKGKKRTRPADAVKEFILKQLNKNPTDIVSQAARQFGISHVAVQKHLRALVGAEKIIKEGNTRSTTWKLAPRNTWKQTYQVNKKLTEHEVWQNFVGQKIEQDTAANVLEIAKYGFTEMLNNVIDHSSATSVDIEVSHTGGIYQFTISDNGVGIFRKIQEAFKLSDPRESILELSKGKVTTDPQKHSGEGIFFTSRAFDRFELGSRGIVFIKDNLNDDWLVDSRQDGTMPGTSVVFRIRKKSPTVLKELFNKYADPNTFRFDRTHIVVELAKNQETEYVSRSQAKRILAGLEKFRHVVLDFRNVRTVGQAFVDEVFRVFSQEHPEVKFEVIHANDNVQFMINRGIATAEE